MYKMNHIVCMLWMALLVFLFLPPYYVHHVGDSPAEKSAATNFYHAHHYTSLTAQHVTVSDNMTSNEPPKGYKPKGETEFSPKKYLSLKEKNSEANETRSITKFPYHRFDVKVSKDVKPEDKITIHWEGKSLPGRQVTMYVWNIPEEKWIGIDQRLADEHEFELDGTITAEEYVENNQLSVIVQDQVSIRSKSYDYSFIWMSDTQYYAQDHPAIFKTLTEWIIQHKAVMNIKYVIHTGDIVNKGQDLNQWQRADTYMNTLDVAKIPYGVLPGNHDVGDDFKLYQRYFGENRFRKKPYYGGSYQNNRGHYDLISVNGKDYLFIYMGGNVKDADIEWMNRVLAGYKDRTAILVFHEYLKKNGKRSQQGNAIFEKVVVPNKHVVAVLSGHYHSSRLLVDSLDDDQDGIADRNVYQLLADYQKGPEGGSGFIRLLHIDEETNSIDVQTYSPYLDRYYYYHPDKYPGKDQFTMEIDVKRTEKLVATRYFEVKVYKQIRDDYVAFLADKS